MNQGLRTCTSCTLRRVGVKSTSTCRYLPPERRPGLAGPHGAGLGEGRTRSGHHLHSRFIGELSGSRSRGGLAPVAEAPLGAQAASPRSGKGNSTLRNRNELGGMI